MAITLTTGPVWRNPNTQTVVVNVLNVSDKPQTVTVSVIDRTNCNNTESGKVSFLCGQPVSPDGTAQPLVSTCDPLSDPTCAMEPVFTPVTFTIPSQGLLTVYAIPNTPFFPPNPCFEARVTGPFSASIFPPSPCRISVVGIDAAGVPQIGNTLFHSQFAVVPSASV